MAVSELLNHRCNVDLIITVNHALIVGYSSEGNIGLCQAADQEAKGRLRQFSKSISRLAHV